MWQMHTSGVAASFCSSGCLSAEGAWSTPLPPTLGPTNLCASLEPHCTLSKVSHAGLLQQLRCHNAECAQQGPAGVDDLKLAVAGEGGGVGGESYTGTHNQSMDYF